MLVLRSVLQTHKFCLLHLNTRHSGVISRIFLKTSHQGLSNSSNSRTCLHTRRKSSLQHPNLFGTSFNRRHLTQEPTGSKFVSKHEADKVSKDYELIYSNGLVKYYQAVQIFLYPVSVFGAVSSAYLVWKNYEDFFQSAIDMGDHPFIAGCTFLVVCSAMIVVFCNICRRALLRIYINPQTGDYVGIKYPWNFLKQQITFTKNDVEIGGSQQLLPFNRGNFKIKGQPFLIVGHDFISPNQYNTLTGSQESWDEEGE